MSVIKHQSVDEKTRVLIVSHSYVVAENRKNVKALNSKLNVKVVVPHKVSDAIHDSLYATSEPCFSVYRRLSLWGAQYLLLTLDMGMRTYQPNIIHIEYDPWSVIFWQVYFYKCLFSRSAKIICTAKNNTYRRYPGLRGLLKFKLAQFFISRCDYFLMVNKGVENIYREIFLVPPVKAKILQHLGVDTDVFRPTLRANSDPDLVVGYCGRFTHHKGILDLLKVVETLRVEGFDLKLKVLGSGELKHTLLNKNFEWLSILDPVPHPQVASFMQSLDIFVLPSLISNSHHEHDAHVLLEAMACGIPVIGSTSGIIPELIDSKSGMVFQAGNLSDLKLKMLAMLSSVTTRRDMATRSLELVRDQYSVDIIATEKFKIYQKVYRGDL